MSLWNTCERRGFKCSKQKGVRETEVVILPTLSPSKGQHLHEASTLWFEGCCLGGTGTAVALKEDFFLRYDGSKCPSFLRHKKLPNSSHFWVGTIPTNILLNGSTLLVSIQFCIFFLIIPIIHPDSLEQFLQI